MAGRDFHRNYSRYHSSCDALSLQHTVKIRTKFCSLARYEILISSSHYGDCITNNHFITKASFPWLGIFQLHVASSSLCSFGTFFINFGGCAEPWLNTTAIATCPYILLGKNTLFELAEVHTAFSLFSCIPFVSVVGIWLLWIILYFYRCLPGLTSNLL